MKIAARAKSCPALALGPELLRRADNGLSECARSVGLGMTHSWLEPKPLFLSHLSLSAAALGATQSQLNQRSTSIISTSD